MNVVQIRKNIYIIIIIIYTCIESAICNSENI